MERQTTAEKLISKYVGKPDHVCQLLTNLCKKEGANMAKKSDSYRLHHFYSFKFKFYTGMCPSANIDLT